MNRFTIYNVLRILAAFTALANVVAEAVRHQPTIYVTKPLTTALLVAVALLASPPLHRIYRTLVAAGLMFSLAGDILLMLPGDRFVLGLASFLVAHLCYAAGFLQTRRGGLAFRYAAPFAIFGVGMLAFLWEGLAILKVPVACYVLVIQTMAWQAWATWGETRRRGALLAALGASVFLVSDSLLALDRFHEHFAGARVGVMATYFLAQWLIASSVPKTPKCRKDRPGW
jgi:uncharacterized membrane protein YhhN